MAPWRSSSKNPRKMNLQPILNNNSLWAHTELEFDVLGVTRKLVKYGVHSSKRKNPKVIMDKKSVEIIYYFCLSADSQYLSISSLSKVRKLCIIVQILNK
jgi:hypothetical protein